MTFKNSLVGLLIVGSAVSVTAAPETPIFRLRGADFMTQVQTADLIFYQVHNDHQVRLTYLTGQFDLPMSPITCQRQADQISAEVLGPLAIRNGLKPSDFRVDTSINGEMCELTLISLADGVKLMVRTLSHENLPQISKQLSDDLGIFVKSEDVPDTRLCAADVAQLQTSTDPTKAFPQPYYVPASGGVIGSPDACVTAFLSIEK